MPHISVVIPVYRAEDCLEELYRRLNAALKPVTPDFEIILVEDCGGDCSWQIIRELARRDPRVKGIQFSRNFGQHYGITAGLDYCDSDWVIVMDCDLQDRPEEIPRLYAMAREGYDVVLARRGTRNDPWLKRVLSWGFYRLFRYLTDTDYDGDAGNYRIVSRKVVVQCRRMREQLRFFGGLINWMGFPTASIDVTHAPSRDGKSTYTYGTLWRLAIDTVIAYSDKPLRVSVRFGFIMSFLAIAYGVYLVGRWWLLGSPVQGWSSVIVSLYFMGGIIVSILGVIGIYLGKTFTETKKRPLYIVANATFREGAESLREV